jgi:hypothetical protein
MSDDPDAKNRLANPLTLEDAKARVAELARWGYTEALVVNDLRIRVERIESKIGSEPALEAAEISLAVAEARPALYAERHAFRLEPYYSRHVNAMTAEALHSKGAIAAELAYRDQQIARLREALSTARSEITRLGTDGGEFSCAVIDVIDAALGGVKGAGP